MTRKEFKQSPPLYKWVLFEGKPYEVKAVNTQELLGLDIGTDTIFWVRCENVEIK